MKLTANNPIVSILDDNKLIGPNFVDWMRNLKLVLQYERATSVLDGKPPMPADPSNPTNMEHELLVQWEADDNTTRCYMLAFMNPDLQRQHENYTTAASILEHL